MRKSEQRRLLEFVGDAEVEARASAQTKPADRMVLMRADGARLLVSSASLRGLASSGALERRGARLRLTEAGRMLARRLAADAGESGYGAQHREMASDRVVDGGRAITVDVNLNESPLAQLMRLKRPDGATFLTEREVRSGERLRSDYTSGSMMPRVGANWDSSVSSGRRGLNGELDLTDRIIAARRRVEKAILFVGPEMADVLIDVCCFLKGMETVERERQWPARSAKLMLKAGLGMLSRHYEPQQGSRRSTLHWGADGYRPALRA